MCIRDRPEVATQVGELLDQRLEHHSYALACLKAAYPEYARGLEAALLEQMAVRLEYAEYRKMLAASVISKEVYNDLKREVDQHSAAIVRPNLDLGLDAHRLVENMPFFASLSADHQTEVCRMLKARLAFPGEQVVTEGERGCLLYTSPSPRDLSTSRMPSSA